MFVHSFLNGISLVFFEATANTLFLTQYDTSELPYVYILTSIISVFLGFLYTKLEEKFVIKKLLNITLLFILASVVIFYVVIKLFDIKLANMGIMVFKDIIWMFSGIEFGILTGIIFDIRQGKRLFGLLMSGEILAGIIGGFSIGILLEHIEIIDLLIISSFSLVVSFMLLLKIIRTFSSSFDSVSGEDDEDEIDGSNSYISLIKNKYYLVFFAISLLSFFVFYFIDYIFYFKVEEHYTNEKELASFFGIFIALLNGVNLISSLFISGKSLSRYGISFGILAIPMLAIIGTSSILVTLSISIGVAFFLIIIVKLLNEVLDISILTPSFRIIYQSIPNSQRNKVLAFRETIIEPIAMGGAGLFLLGISFLEGIDIVYYLIIIFGIAWFFLGKILTGQYLESLKKIINNRMVFSDDDLLNSLDPSMFLERLKSNNDIEVIYAAKSLEKINYKHLDDVFKDLIFHDSSQVQIYAYESIARLELHHFSGTFALLLDSKTDDEVISSILQAYGKILEADAIDIIVPYLNSNSSVIKEAAIVSLMKYCGIDGILLAGDALNESIKINSQESNIQVLKTLNHIGIPGFYDFLRTSLKSKNKNVKNLAIEVLGNLQIKRLLPILISLIQEQEYKARAVQSIIKFGDSISENLMNVYNNSDSLDEKRALIKVLSSMKNKKTDDFLLEHISNPLVIDSIIGSMFNANFHSSDKYLIENILVKNLKIILDILTILKNINKRKYPNTYKVFEEEKITKIENLFFILGFIYPHSMVIQAKTNYKSNSKDKRALAVELLDNMVDSNLRKSIIPILENTSVANKLAHFEKAYPMKKKNERECFNNILCSDDYLPIVKISLIYEIGLNKDRQYLKCLENISSSTNPHIKETALWTLKKIK